MNMNLLLHPSDFTSGLSERYRQAFANAVELLIVNAYLTEWDSSLVINSDCKHFRMIIGKDFGLTRKSACRAVLGWLPRGFKAWFMVAGEINGFHPKAVFWKEASGQAFAIIGSSNLTVAAFATNYEANIFSRLSLSNYQMAKNWISTITQRSVPVSDAWLNSYREAPVDGRVVRPKRKSDISDDIAQIRLKLPRIEGMSKAVNDRRAVLEKYGQRKRRLLRLFQSCADNRITSSQFYNALSSYWGIGVGNRIQNIGWERRGKASDFRELAISFIKIVEAGMDTRDDVAVEELNRLAEIGTVPARGAFLSEMLCLHSPSLFPLINKPVKDFLQDVGFGPSPRVSEGERYMMAAQTLRVSLEQTPNYPAKNLAELDAIIELKYR